MVDLLADGFSLLDIVAFAVEVWKMIASNASLDAEWSNIFSQSLLAFSRLLVGVNLSMSLLEC